MQGTVVTVPCKGDNLVLEEQILNARILIVDDNMLIVQILKKILTDAGYYHLSFTTDPAKAFDMYQEIQPDLVLL
ncbi:MAG: response regulator, partial [Candidatus Omnitrophica bacterium]|nr:response regulator [Candidatus Omnitrophota bacterium]